VRAEIAEVGGAVSFVNRLWAEYNALRGDAYDLDATARRHDGSKFKCDTGELVLYRGERLSYGGAVRVHPAFAARLRHFETITAQVATEVYGRAPTRIRHLGTYSCRNSRNRSNRISEHALGNAIDVAGFDFGPAPKAERAQAPASQRWGFKVSVDRHFNAERGDALQHRRFLRLLIERLEQERPFRVMLGPNHRGHANHFHFDMSPWTYSDV
jgi:hypothetical protein